MDDEGSKRESAADSERASDSEGEPGRKEGEGGRKGGREGEREDSERERGS